MELNIKKINDREFEIAIVLKDGSDVLFKYTFTTDKGNVLDRATGRFYCLQKDDNIVLSIDNIVNSFRN